MLSGMGWQSAFALVLLQGRLRVPLFSFFQIPAAFRIIYRGIREAARQSLFQEERVDGSKPRLVRP